MNRRRHGFRQEGRSFGGRRAAILRAAGQNRQLPDRGDAFDRQSCGQPAHKAGLAAGVAPGVLLADAGAMGARVGGANILRATVRMTFWGALAMAITAGVGKCFVAVV